MLRYQESKARSAELLRQVVGLMGQHEAPFNPISFAVWYEYASGMNRQLTYAIEAALQGGQRLDAQAVFSLYQSHVADIDPSVIQQIASNLHHMMGGMALKTAQVGEQAQVFGAELQGLTQALLAPDAAGLRAVVSHALAQVSPMSQALQDLSAQVAQSQHDIESLKGELVRVRDEALVDQLTHVLNRRGFDLQLAEMLHEPAAPGCAHGLIMIDIDHFKGVNDQHGHVMGDRILQATAGVLRACVSRKGPTVARYGGEEFAILLPHSSLSEVMALAHLVREQVRAMTIRDWRTQALLSPVTVSAGVAIVQPEDTAAQLVARADEALYASKRNGRDRVSCA